MKYSIIFVVCFAILLGNINNIEQVDNTFFSNFNSLFSTTTTINNGFMSAPFNMNNTRPEPAITDSASDYVKKLLDQSEVANKQAEIAVKAFAESTSLCRVNVTCDEAHKHFSEIQNNLKTTSEAFKGSAQAKQRSNQIMEQAKALINSIRSGSAQNELSDLAKQSTDQATNTAKLAFEATATALTKCELVVNITCSECPSNNTTTTEDLLSSSGSPAANAILDSIRSNISSILR
jgi:hypothetical protein